MKIFDCLFKEICPQCQRALETNKSDIFKGIIIKACPNGHFQKEFHPALETYIESNKVS
ncbi:hypothetical protein [Mesobacillus foraminis]|uniref:hypothetical protein n=1 Tax=Mesobacillus foraminis TaxID=279826 RepID=UPI0013CE91DD|nr:hypothetical protein [Mesobacillus foraminis]